MTDDLVLSVSRADDGRWQVEADDGSLLEGPFASRGSATRWIEDRADLSVLQGEVRRRCERRLVHMHHSIGCADIGQRVRDLRRVLVPAVR